MKIKKIGLLLGGFVALATPLLAISCKQENKLLFSVNEPWFGNKEHKFFNKILEKYQEARKNKVEMDIKYIAENNDLVSVLKKGTSNIGVITTPLYVLQENQNSNILPIIQTLTRAFKFDKNFNDKYSNGMEDDKLRQIAKNAQELFEAKPYTQWTNDEYKWNGNIYEHFYANENELVEHYRGLIMIHGTENERNAIKKAWDEKDWNSFRNFGLITGKQTSGSKYILQEQLFRKHFNLEGNKFTSFAEDKLQNADKYTIDKARNIGKGSLKKFHIVFDELASFAYTNNKKGNLYTPEDNDSKIEFLTATEPLKYNIIAVDKRAFNDQEINDLKNIIINVWREKQDDYGPTVGFNGYKTINDHVEEVINPYNEIFN
ncbi:ABC transporter thiamine pyrophosphate-binding lipoprotein p37/Cypl [Metamycoplasma gateae]|uniref:Alkylphosphonate ABC transporter substrate-binidng protein n=1 Tax=Metamycoplasma gateae TaxID=35769 RepID=A0ABZ2AH89_9BACT|nr:alkylphosphonate ABC transporter substrate-binidng protein [Metamycoplasma gateae]